MKSKIDELLALAKVLADHNYEIIGETQSSLKEKTVDIVNYIKSKKCEEFGTIGRERRKQIAMDMEQTKKFLKEFPEIILTKADKGNATVASNRDTFTKLRDKHIEKKLKDGTYVVSSLDINECKKMIEEGIWKKTYIMLARHINNNVGKSNHILASDVNEMEVLKHYNCPPNAQTRQFSPGRMFGHIKTHKKEIAFRPTIDYSVKLGGTLEEFMLKKLTSILEKVNIYNVKSTTEVLYRIKNRYEQMFLPLDHSIVSIDFDDMYTNIPFDRAIEILKKEWDKIYPKPTIHSELDPYMGPDEAAQVITFFVPSGN